MAPTTVPPLDRRALPADMLVDRLPAGDGWLLRRFRWAPAGGAGRGSLLFQGGRGDHLEKYLEAAGHWRDRGWAVTGFDWRGQGGSGRLLANARIGHATQLDPLADDLAAFVADWIATTPGPHVAVGHSMGGHLMLRLLAEHAPPLAAVVLVAPMLGLASQPIPAPVARLVTQLMARCGFGTRPVWSDRLLQGALDRQRNLTGSAERYADELWWRAARPELALGPPSWHWLAAAFASIARLDRPGVLERVTTPVLLLGAERDRLVSATAIRRAAARLPNAELRMFADAAHELLREDDAVRLAVLAAVDRFLDAHTA